MNKYEYKLFKTKWKLLDLKTMHEVLKNDKDVKIFNANKSCYIPIEGFYLFKLLFRFSLSRQIKKLEHEKWDDYRNVVLARWDYIN